MHVRIEFIDGDKTGQEKNEAWNGQRVNRDKSTNDLWGNIAREMVEATLKWREKRVSGRREDVSKKSGMRTQKIICCHFSLVKREAWASLVVQWLRICLPMQGTRVRTLVWEDPTCRGATRPVSHNY